MNPSETDQARLQWRRALPEQVVRSLAADYLRGKRDPEFIDAYAEYKARYELTDNQAAAVSPNSSRSRRRRNRRNSQ